MFNVGFRLFAGDDSADVLNKVDAAFLAITTLPLFVLTAGAAIAQRGMASLAESGYVASLCAASRTFHIAILSGWRAVCAITGTAICHIDNCSSRGGSAARKGLLRGILDAVFHGLHRG
jgi:hypothetical protein